MKSTERNFTAKRPGFTLIEMIGVLAIMAILAAVVTPSALQTLDRATIRAETDTLHNLGEQVKNFLKAKGWLPGLNPIIASRLSWDQDLWNFADISSADLLTNKRQILRSYIYEPSTSPKRVLILSCMHVGLTLPTATNLNTLALFDNVWNTTDGSVPPAGTSWAGWAPWRTSLNGAAGDYLVIERVNLLPISNTDLQTEVATVQTLGEQVKLFLRNKGWIPGLNPVVASRLSWNLDLATCADISAADILTNKRQIARAFIYEPAASPKRALILSSMSTGLALPTAANLNTMALFDNVWNTTDGSVPPAGTSWAGWATWRAATAGDYPVIERVNLAPLYMTVWLTNNSTTTSVYYQVIPSVGVPYGAAILKGKGTTLTLFPNDQVNLYNLGALGPKADYTYIASSGTKVIDFNDAKFWLPQ